MNDELVRWQVNYFRVKREERPHDREWDDYLICRAMGYGRENIADEGPFKANSSCYQTMETV